MMYLDELTTFEFKKRVEEDNNLTVILPIGAVEEHGEHLPLSTDSLQPEYIAEQLAKDLDILIAPPIRYGICNATKNFAGTITLSFNTFQVLVQEILSELCRHGVKNIIVLSGHAGRVHMAALRVAGEAVIEKYPKIKLMLLSDYDIIYKYQGDKFPAWDGHAGSVETSRIMAIKPDLIKGSGKMSKIDFPPYRILPDLESYFPSGVMGDPGSASEYKGKDWNELVIKELKELINNMLESEK
jgi:creatinine amidohydrolase